QGHGATVCGAGGMGAQKTSAPGRGGRPGACMSEAFGGNRARRGNGTVLKRAFWLSPLPSDADGVQPKKNKRRFLHIGIGKNACDARELNLDLSCRAYLDPDSLIRCILARLGEQREQCRG